MLIGNSGNTIVNSAIGIKFIVRQRKIVVKIIDTRGIESLVIKKLEQDK